MKKSLFALILVSLCASAFCLEPVGVVVPFPAKAGLKAGESSTIDAAAFPGSSFVKVHLGSLLLGEGDSLLVSDGKDSVYEVSGPFSGPLWLPSVESEAAFLTLASKNGSGSASYTVDEVGVGFSAPAEPESVCGSDDRRNPLCYSSDKQTAGLAVGRMKFASGGYMYVCTGSLVSASGHFLTNNHCIEDQYGADSLEVWWRYEATTCEGAAQTYEYRTMGSAFLKTNGTLDYTLLQIDDPELYERYGYLRIAARTALPGETIWVPQHGGGGMKRFAVESDMDGGPAKVIDESITGNAKGTDIGYWADTEGGSSGSPVLDSNNKILALHHFGLPSGAYCDSSYMNQGVKMSLIYPEIAEYIGSVIPPTVSSVKKAVDPFRLIIEGKNFKEGISAYIGADPTPWPYYSYKNAEKYVIKGNKTLKALFPKGVPVTITLVNPDGGTVYTSFTR